MKLPHIGKKKYIGGALAAAIAMGGGGVAFAYLAGHGTGTGSASVHAATELKITVGTTSASLTKPTDVDFTYTNLNAFNVKVTKDATVTAVKQTSPTGSCFTSVALGDTLLAANEVTTTPATALIGTAGTVAGSAASTAATSTQVPTITLHNTTSTAQTLCKFTITVTV